MRDVRFNNLQRYNPIKLDISSLLKSIYNKSFEYQEILANIYRQEVVDVRTYNLIVINVLGNKISKSLEHENNLPANQNTRLSETEHLENKANMPIYLLSPILLLIIQKKRSLSLSDFLKQDAILQANLLVLESLLETS
jgi:hypothetical protein